MLPPMTSLPHVAKCHSYPVQIFTAGDYDRAVQVCQEYCDRVGLCVTVSRTLYVYTGGQEHGLVVGLINYLRFPALPGLIESRALELAHLLRTALGQDSFTIQTPEKSAWYSWRS